MGLTKQYLRYVPDGKFNITNSVKCNVTFVTLQGKAGIYAAVGASEDAYVWDTRLSSKVAIVEGGKFEATWLAFCETRSELAVGYSDGTLKTFEMPNGNFVAEYSGHRSAISTIVYDCQNQRLATGSRDTDVVVWDVIGETGLFRLKGHKAPITAVRFMPSRNILITSSKDKFIKFWDLYSGYCFETLSTHLTEVWGICLVKNDSYLVSGSNDNELRVWKIADGDQFVDDYNNKLRLREFGSILRQGLGRVVSVFSDNTSGCVVCCHGNDKMLELFYFLPEEEVARKFRKKQKKVKKKLEAEDMEVDEGENTELNELTRDSLKFAASRLPVVRCDSKIKSADVWFNGFKIKVCLALASNAIEVHVLYARDCKESSQINKVSCGHDSDVRSLAFSGDETILATGSRTEVKFWNRESLECLRSTHKTDSILCICFIKGDEYAIAGTKSGSLLIINVETGDVSNIIECAHDKEIWTITSMISRLDFLTCSSDASLKIWRMRRGKEVCLEEARKFPLDEAALCAKATPDGNLICVALLDSTVRIIFVDSFKLFLTLYGHKLPVACLDISYDSTLIVTGSADRTVKIWGLDYGDCHRSLKAAHDDTITAVSFLPKTHYFFTCGKDGMVKQWDADNFQRILTLPGHHGEAWSLSASNTGRFMASCGSDRVLRLFKKTLEPLVLEDEREEERAREEEESLATGEGRGEDSSAPLGSGALILASRKTVTAEKAAELLLECVQTIREHKEAVAAAKGSGRPVPLPLLMEAFGADTYQNYCLAIVSRIRSSELESALALLSLSNVCELLEELTELLRGPHHRMELVIRAVIFLVRIHFKPITCSGEGTLRILSKLQPLARKRLRDMEYVIGMNLHILLLIRKHREEESGAKMFEEAMIQCAKNKAKKRLKHMIASTAVLKV